MKESEGVSLANPRRSQSMDERLTSDSDSWVQFAVLPVRQPIGTFYVGVVPARDLVAISKADVRGLAEESSPRTAPGDAFAEYMGIQRPLNRDRVWEIQQYVRT